MFRIFLFSFKIFVFLASPHLDFQTTFPSYIRICTLKEVLLQVDWNNSRTFLDASAYKTVQLQPWLMEAFGVIASCLAFALGCFSRAACEKPNRLLTHSLFDRDIWLQAQILPNMPGFFGHFETNLSQIKNPSKLQQSPEKSIKPPIPIELSWPWF